MKLGICAIVKDENEYLDEWLSYHKSIGIDKFYLYDNESKDPIKPQENVKVTWWTDNEVGSQMRAYQNLKTECDFIAYIDIDEFIVCKDDLKETMWKFEQKYGKYDALAMSWRMYGSNPYFTERQPQESYTKYYKNDHIKSFVRPDCVIKFPDPHFARIQGRYIDELGRPVKGPLHPHTSEEIFIKHIYTRSLPEWEEKIKRGSGDKVKRVKTMDEFFNHNKACIHEIQF